MKMMREDVEAVEARTFNGVEYALFRSMSTAGGFVRVQDKDSDNLVSLHKWPQFERAQAKYLRAVEDFEDPPAVKFDFHCLSSSFRDARIAPTNER